jgi:aspartyl-tRNA(Asn)/glutamyl-tRNA(Gln) amidotransferase subunit C
MSKGRESEIDEKLMNTLAALSAVEFPVDERNALRADLCKILGYVERLKELDLGETETPPETGICSAPDVPDVPAPGLARNEAFRNAPDIQGSFFKAPPIIERQDS